MNQLEHEHAAMVDALAKPGEDILASLTAEKCHDIHMAMGIIGEAGELVDAIKKYVMYEKDLDRENVVEEFGDMEFYMEGLRNKLGISRDETLTANMNKLGKRYKDFQYSDQRAQDRADK